MSRPLFLDEVPTYKVVCERYGFPVPPSYYKLLTLGAELSPDNPWDAYEAIGLVQLDHTKVSPKRSGFVGYSDTFVDLAIFGWSGIDGSHFAFVIDVLPVSGVECPIVHFYPSNTRDTGLIASSLPDFLGCRIASAYEGAASGKDEWRKDLRERLDDLVPALVDGLEVVIPDDASEVTRRARKNRLAAGAVPTIDGIGIMLPEGSVDRGYLSGIRWRDPKDHRDGATADISLLDEAARRLSRGELGTAIVIARNFRYLYWYDDWNGSRNYIQQTAVILSEAYHGIGRPDLAEAVRQQTRYALDHVL